MRRVGDAVTHIAGLTDYVYRRTRDRLSGLTDEEYFWEPARGCATLRRTPSGTYRADPADPPAHVLQPATGTDDPPFTTIAWRLWHLSGTYGGKRNPQWLGVPRAPGGFDQDDPAPGTAAQALAALDRAHRLWQGVLQELAPEHWWQPLGPAAGLYAEQDRAALVLHQLDEQIHHGAELALLRDLYRHRTASG